jgi:hypothetical protein
MHMAGRKKARAMQRPEDLSRPSRWRLQHGDFTSPIREADPETGLTVVHRRAVDTIGVMLGNGTITPAMHDAGQVFRTLFQRAALHGVRIASLLRITGTPQPSLTEAQGMAREKVARALAALGGFDSPCGSIAWHVLGLEISIRDWARRQGWGGRLMHPAQAQGTLISALGVLAAHYRLEIRPRAA